MKLCCGFLFLTIIFFSCKTNHNKNDLLIKELKWVVYLSNIDCYTEVDKQKIMFYSLPLKLKSKVDYKENHSLYKFEFYYNDQPVNTSICSLFNIVQVDNDSKEIICLGENGENVILPKEMFTLKENALKLYNKKVSKWLERQLNIRMKK